jgi:anti-sigma regulatory factor (Ser/Thr protein kinase)
MRPTSDISWQRWPTLPFPTDRPRVRLALSPSVEAPALARRAVSGLAAELSEDELWKLQLLMSELITNVVVHAGAMSPPRATATLWVSPERLRGDVLDRGLGFRPRVEQPEPDSPGGRGLLLVSELADDWGVVPGRGSWVWFELRRQPAQARSTRRSARIGTDGESVDWSKYRSSPAPSAANASRTSSTYEPSTTATPPAAAVS